MSGADAADVHTTAPARAADRRRRRTADVEVLDPRARLQHRLLSIVAVTSVVGFGAIWIRTVWADGGGRLANALLSLVLVAAVAGWLARWFSITRMRRPVHEPPQQGLRVAAVTTFVASQEPLDMLEKTLVAMRDMSHPHDTWVLDEEDDAAVRALCARLGVLHHSRRDRPDYQMVTGRFARASKYGNYNAWCDEIGYGRYDVLAAFDPDHVPAPEYLERTLGYLAVEHVAYVQTPQVYYNQDASFVARGAAEESYAYYSTHLMASYGLGHTVVIGSHGVHRLAALRDVGGFPAHDAEDLYLTIVYRAEDWRGVYVPEVLAMGMTPVDWSGYLKQQARWARSLLDVKLRVLPQLSGRLSFVTRVLNLLHGAGYLRPLLVPFLFAGIMALLVTNAPATFLAPAAVASAAAVYVVLTGITRFQQRYYLDPVRERGIPWRSAALQVAKWPAFARAVVQLLRGRHVGYALTAKTTRAHREWSVLPVQLAVAVAVAAAWYVGVARHGDLRTALDLLAAVAVAVPLALAATDVLPVADGFSAALYDARYRDMSLAGADERK